MESADSRRGEDTMLRALIRTVVILIVVIAAAAFLLGWWGGGRVNDDRRDAVGTTGVPAPDTPGINREKAREVGAEIGERTADAADQAKRALSDGSLTTKIKAKMALDDSVKALDIDVDTSGSTVTLTGVVDTEAQRQRALQLARETAGITQVVDRLRVRQ
jgi:hyperosmotically inducible protein